MSQRTDMISHNSKPYDEELWDLFVSAMPANRDIPDTEKQIKLETVLLISRGSREEAKQYLKYVKHTLNTGIKIGFRCPEENIQCNTVEFDNIKVFYHPTYPIHLRCGPEAWNFYIARPGASASQCIDWAAEGIKIDAFGPTGRWGECLVLAIAAGTRVRITYPFGYERRTREIVFPSENLPVDTIYLEKMD